MSSNIVFKNSTGKTTYDGKQFGKPVSSTQGQVLLSDSNNDFGAVSAPMSFKNKIINGAMTICQRPITEISAFSSGYSGYNLDRWKAEYKSGVMISNSSTTITDFQSGNTFAVNGWTEVNGTQTNKWYVGSFGGTGTTGNSAVISTNGATKGYNTLLTSIVHFYKDIQIPASSTGSLYFQFNGNICGEGSYDNLSITIANTSYTPVAGSASTGTSVFNSSGYSWNTFYYGPFTSNSIDAYKGQIVRVIFTWTNDSSGGTSTGGASVDNIAIIDASVSSSLGYKSLTPTTSTTTITNFESGNTFALNGFVEVNGAQTNKWYVGTFGGTGQSGTYSAVTSSNGTSKGYNVNVASVVHFYKDITVPAAGSFSKTYLRFNANISGEGTTTLYDYVQIRTDSTTNTPVAGTLGTTGFEIFKSASATGQQSIDISQFCGQTIRLVFTWRNDGSTGSGVGATIDDIQFYQTTAVQSNMISQSSSVYPSAFKNSLAYECYNYTPCVISQSIEAYNCQDLLFGTSSAKDVTVSFWVRSGEAGTYCAYLQNAAKTLTYIKEYAISSADTWERKVLTIPGCTTGTWTAGTTSAYMIFGFSLQDGSSSTASPNTWNANGYTQTSKQTNFTRIANVGKFFYVTGVQLEANSVATPFEFRPEHTELELCQRYYQINLAKTVSGAAFANGVASSTSSSLLHYKLNNTMRAAPTMSYLNITYFALSDGGALRYTNAFSISATVSSVAITASANFANLTSARAQTLVHSGVAPAYLEFSSEL